ATARHGLRPRSRATVEACAATRRTDPRGRRTNRAHPRDPIEFERASSSPAASKSGGSGVTEESDIWRAARLLVDRLGADAHAHAADRARELLEIGDRAGHALWTE